MGISISEHSDTFHVPYGSPNNDGTPEASFVDVKAHPKWIPVLPSCVGWPETQALLKAINSPSSILMSLAANQGFTISEHLERSTVLTSFVVLCLADVSHNEKPAIQALADFLKRQMDDFLQEVSNALKQSLYVHIRLELQPTRFHLHGLDGWSLMVMMATEAIEKREARSIWGMGMEGLVSALEQYNESR